MNNGAFGENFPYSNFHDLNMDWIIKIAKDFLDQYTHIQEVIANGEESLQNKADALEALLQQWYNTHSEDIANQLADALEDLNNWYTEHQNYLDQTLQDKTAEFNNNAESKASETIASIPADYTSLANNVASMQDSLLYKYAKLANDSTEYRSIRTSEKFTFKQGKKYIITLYNISAEIPGVCYVAMGNIWQFQCTYGIKNSIQLEFTAPQYYNGYINVWAPRAVSIITCNAIVCDSSIIEMVNNIFNLYNIAPLQNIPNAGNMASARSNFIFSETTDMSVFKYSPNVVYVKGTQPSNWNAPISDYVTLDNTKIYTCFVDFQRQSDCDILLLDSAFHAQWNELTGEQIEFNKYVNCIKFKPRTSGSYCFSIFGSPVEDVFELYLYEGDVDISDSNHPWRGKKIVWYGTSIPAGVRGRRYPQIVGKILGAEVINKAIGSSPVHSQMHSRVTTANPYGFTNNFEAASKTMMNDTEKQNWIINNYNSGVFTVNVPETMTEGDAQWIRDHFGYNVLIDGFLTDEKMPDLFIFDHGHNDNMSAEDDFDGSFNEWTFQGAMGFLLQRIYNYNAKARILLIGEYEDQLRPYISKYQKKVADEWSIPIMPQWSIYGWSQQQITTKDAWINGVWEKDVLANPQTITKLNTALADGIHPYSDVTNKTNIFMADHIAKWLTHFMPMEK